MGHVTGTAPPVRYSRVLLAVGLLPLLGHEPHDAGSDISLGLWHAARLGGCLACVPER
jgi:hypothetical protein